MAEVKTRWLRSLSRMMKATFSFCLKICKTINYKLYSLLYNRSKALSQIQVERRPLVPGSNPAWDKEIDHLRLKIVSPYSNSNSRVLGGFATYDIFYILNIDYHLISPWHFVINPINKCQMNNFLQLIKSDIFSFNL